MMNRVILVGRITKDPELKVTQSNIPVVTFTLAVNRQFADESGERQADFIQCVVWRKQAENMQKYVSKGSLLGVEGRVQTRQYEADNGMRYITEVVCDNVQFLETKKQDAQEEAKDEKDEFYETSKQLAVEEDLPF